VNVDTATATQRLLKYLLDDDETIECADARAATAAARTLAGRSFTVLGSGMTPDDIPELGGCDGCAECVRPITTVPVGQML
jgi:hypothetical protein